MKKPILFLRIIGACVLVGVLPEFWILVDALNLVRNAWVPDGANLLKLMGTYQILWWLVTAASGFVLMVPHMMGKWLLATSFVLSAVLGGFVSWLPGASFVFQFVEQLEIRVVLLHLVNGLFVIGAFWLSRECNLTWRSRSAASRPGASADKLAKAP